MGHLGYAGLHFLLKSENVMGVPQIDMHAKICHCCLVGRQHREQFPKKTNTRSNKPGLRIHTHYRTNVATIIGRVQVRACFYR